jgi:phospholipase/carboxylesterase
VAGLLDELAGQGVAGKDTVLFGFSQGCLVAMDAGLRSPRPLAGVCGVSGWVASLEEYPGALSPEAKRRKYLVTHGLQDPLLPYDVTAAQCRRLGEMGLDLEFKTYAKEHTMLPEEVLDVKAWLAERFGF